MHCNVLYILTGEMGVEQESLGNQQVLYYQEICTIHVSDEVPNF